MDRYAMRGVSTGKEGVHKAIAHLDKGAFPGAFSTIVPDTHGRFLVPHADGAGTKASLAYLAHKHGADISVWHGIAQDSIVMNIDDAGCVGAFGGTLLQIINRNKFRVPDSVVEEIVAGAEAFCDLMRGLGFDLRYVGGETADVADLVRTLTLDNCLFIPSVQDREIIDASRIEVGDVIVGFSSTGQTVWESEPNSGMGSNGLTNARHDVLHPMYRADTETYAPEIPPEEVYAGTYYLDDKLPGDERFTIASALLSPTRTYLPLMKALIYGVGRHTLHAFIHCSGGGQTKIGKFGPANVTYVKDKLMNTPPLFMFLQQVRQLPWDQMFKSYNMGHRFEAVVPIPVAEMCMRIAEELGIEAKVVGEVCPRKKADERVIIKSPFGEFSYP